MLSRQIRNCVKASGLPINVAVIPPPNLRALLMRSRFYDSFSCHSSKGDCLICPDNDLSSCQKQGVVYKIDCGEFYIGETGRPLWKRVSEQIRAFKNPTAPSYQNHPLARHRSYPNHAEASCPSLRIKILAQTRKIVERRVAEAYQIFTLYQHLTERRS